MAIPAGTKFHGVAPEVNTKDYGSAMLDALRDAYTIEDIANFNNSATIVEIECKNVSGALIPKGTPVCIVGTVGASTKVQVAVADASNPVRMPATGLLKTDLENNEQGFVITGGLLTNIETDPIDGTTPTINDTIYVKAGGGLTLSRPGGTNLVQNVGKVGKVSGGNAGSIIVSSILRTNDVPNDITTDTTFSANVFANTQTQGDNSTKVATTEYVDSAIGNNNELSEVLANGNTTGGTDISVSSGDNINFADGSIAKFGAGSDLQIYHNGSNSYISDEGTGNLFIQASNSLNLRSTSGEWYMDGIANGAVNLYYNNSKKFETTTQGTKTTGYSKASADGSLTWGSYTFHSFENNTDGDPTMMVYSSATGNVYGLNVVNQTDHNNTTSRFFLGEGGTTERIKIYSNGNIENFNNAYGQLSDVNLKENIADASAKLDDLSQVRVVNFNYIGDDQKQLGVIAQELEEIFPGMVYESGEEQTKAVKYSVFVPMLIKAVQELKARVEALESN